MGAPTTIIKANSSDSHQTSSGIVISFLPFLYRDTYYGTGGSKNVKDALSINKPLIVVNDAVRVTVTSSKESSMDQAEIVLTSGDVNYSAAVAPGDHALIWMVNNQTDFYTISNKVLNEQKNVNYLNSGLKFVGKVNSVRQQLQTDPSGKKMYRYVITLASFTEFQTQIYFNELLDPTMPGGSSSDKAAEWFAQVSDQYQNLFKNANNDSRLKTEDLIKFFTDVFMGPGPKDVSKVVKTSLTRSPNAAFLVPTQLAKYMSLPLGEKAEKSIGVQYTDVLQRVFGQQTFSNKMFPDVQSGSKGYFQCKPLKGGTLVPPANFNNTTLWSILTQFMNPALNEMYTALKYVDSGGRKGIFPVLTLRQIPMTTDKISSKFRDKATFFSNLPRWKVDLNYPILNYNLGTSDAERFNFFQVYTNNISVDLDAQTAMRKQIEEGNYRIDNPDIVRSGPRIHMTFSDTEAAYGANSNINEWAELIADFYANGHLKMNGSITLAGIQEPISVGDNFEFDNKLFHIEGISHSYECEPSIGKKSFTTTLMLSHGYYVNNGKLQYMSDQPTKRQFQADKLLPGYSDEERYVNDVPIVSENQTAAPPAANTNNPAVFLENQLTSAIDNLKKKIQFKV